MIRSPDLAPPWSRLPAMAAGRSASNKAPNTVILLPGGSRQVNIEDFEDDLVIVDPVVPGAKFEARCHLCSWSFHKWTDDDARTCLRTHIIDEHLANIEYRKFVSGTGPNTS